MLLNSPRSFLCPSKFGGMKNIHSYIPCFLDHGSSYSMSSLCALTELVPFSAYFGVCVTTSWIESNLQQITSLYELWILWICSGNYIFWARYWVIISRCRYELTFDDCGEYNKSILVFSLCAFVDCLGLSPLLYCHLHYLNWK